MVRIEELLGDLTLAENAKGDGIGEDEIDKLLSQFESIRVEGKDK